MVEVSTIHGLQLCEGALITSHLLFVNDTLIFCSAGESPALAVKEVLFKYEKAFRVDDEL